MDGVDLNKGIQFNLIKLKLVFGRPSKQKKAPHARFNLFLLTLGSLIISGLK